MQRRILAIVPLLCAVAATRFFGSMILPVYDDAFITFRYAKNLVEMGAFVYNSGEWVLGTTTPLFGLLSAGFYTFGLPMPITAVLLNLCIDLILAYVIYRFVEREYNVTAAIFSVLFFAVSPILIRISVGAMEANLFVLVILGTLFLYRRGKIAWAIVLASLSYFIRPEGALLALFLIGDQAATRQYVAAIKYGVLSFLTVLPGLVVIYLQYGSFISQSVTTKSGEHQDVLEVFRRLVVPEAGSIVFVVIALVGIKHMLRTGGLIRSFCTFAGLYLAAYLIMRPWVWSWYAMPVQVALVVSAGISAAALVRRFSFTTTPVWERYAGVAGMCCVAGVWIGLYAVRGPSGVTSHVYASLAATTSQLGNVKILATDIGAVGYFSNARIYDGLGLVTPEATKHGSLAAMIRATDADALFLNTTKETQYLMDSAYFSDKYEFFRRYGAGGDSSLPSDTAAYASEWQQDYLLFVRRTK